jgi:hypothetical protein
MPWDHDRWRHCIIYNIIMEHFKLVEGSARRKNAISFSFVNLYQTSSTENVWNCLLRMNIWKLSSSLRKSCSVHRFQRHFSVSRKCRVFLAPRNVSLEIQQFFSCQKLSSFNSRCTDVIRLKIVWKLREILQFHNKRSMQYWITSFR